MGIPSNLLRSTCSFEQRTESRDATTGQSDYAWTALYTGVRCRIDENVGREFMSQTGAKIRATHTLFLNSLPLSSIESRGWRVDIGGSKYNILMIADAGGAGHHYELALERIS
jgi:hypothetical protein